MQPNEQDYNRISLELNHEIRYWTQKLQCNKEELLRAVRKVGACVKAVRQELRR